MESDDEDAPQLDAAQCRVDYFEDCNTKRHPVGCSRIPGRVKRVVSCKRKSHRLTVARKKQLGPGRTLEVNGTQEDLSSGPWGFPVNVTAGCEAGETDDRVLSELERDHGTVAEVMLGRSLRLRVALTLWQRNVGELLTYFLRIQDTGVFVDFLPIITKSIDETSARVTIGCCVDLFPLVKQVLRSPYVEHLTVGLKWIHSVLNNWHEALRASDCDEFAFDVNAEVFKQQLAELWYQEPSLTSLPGPAGHMATVIDSFLSGLTCRQ